MILIVSDRRNGVAVKIDLGQMAGVVVHLFVRMLTRFACVMGEVYQDVKAMVVKQCGVLSFAVFISRAASI